MRWFFKENVASIICTKKVSTYVLLHKYTLNVQSKRKLFVIRKKTILLFHYNINCWFCVKLHPESKEHDALKNMMHELFALQDTIVLPYVLFHWYTLEIQNKKKLLWLVSKKILYIANEKHNSFKSLVKLNFGG